MERLPISSDSIVFNENNIAPVIAELSQALTLTLGVNRPQYVSNYMVYTLTVYYWMHQIMADTMQASATEHMFRDQRFKAQNSSQGFNSAKEGQLLK